MKVGATLSDILKQPDLGADNSATIYVERPWSLNAKAILLSPAPDTTEDIDRDGGRFAYFIEAFLAREFLDDLASSHAAVMSESDRHERLIVYAETDA